MTTRISNTDITRRLPGQTLLFDADDTLWENNIYFEQAIAGFISYLNHQAYSPEEVRERLNLVERETIATHGYGLHSFRRSLIDCFEQLSTQPLTPEMHHRIESFAKAIADQEIELLPGVAETLPSLAARHNLIVVTKGHPEEQHDKLDRSGIAEWFKSVDVLAEKHTAAYRDLITKYSLDPATTWMIGNSPRSDINPSLQAGLNAIFLPHHHTWVLEHEHLIEAPKGQHLLTLETFTNLTTHF
jgi:putative hydrolase of the HAD superfamily